MCGLAGFLGASLVAGAEAARQTLQTMAATLNHRGPDASGHWLCADAPVGLAHTRLSIIDLSATGQQPMTSADGRYTWIFNGELYNHQPLREALAQSGIRCRGSSDTEVALETIALRGLDAALASFVGMFAFMLWDRQLGELTLVRDRAGEKPLYLARVAGGWLFASELKALQAHPAFNARLDRHSLDAMLRYGYVPAPRAIYENTWKLPAAHRVCLRPADSGAPYFARWWQPANAADVQDIGVDQACERLDGLLTESLRGQMLADVPVGAFLSGGIDSSLIVSRLCRMSSRPVRTFCIGFEDAQFDESPYARAIAAHLGTEHHEQVVSADQARQVIPLLPKIYDEPFADMSQIPTYLVCGHARRHATVALSGDGGDELFAGYNRYRHTLTRWERARRLGAGAPALARVRARLARSGLDRAYQRRALHAARHDFRAFYEETHRFFYGFETIVPGVPAAPLLRCPPQDSNSKLDWQIRADLDTWLPDNILTKVDRAAMAVSLEVRAPLLDHRIIEFANSLPDATRLDGRAMKRPLKALLARELPAALWDREKKGFNVPIGAWLRGPLRDWAETLLTPERLAADDLLNVNLIRRRWTQHLAGREDWYRSLWHVLVFQAWRQHWCP